MAKNILLGVNGNGYCHMRMLPPSAPHAPFQFTLIGMGLTPMKNISQIQGKLNTDLNLLVCNSTTCICGTAVSAPYSVEARKSQSPGRIVTVSEEVHSPGRGN